MNVRTAKEDDATAISVIASSVFHLACPPQTSRKDLDLYVKENLSPEAVRTVVVSSAHTVYVAEVDGAIAGFSVVNHTSSEIGNPAADGLPELTRCYVTQESQGKGIAQLLIERSLSTIEGAARLMVNDQNVRAISFYRRNGFKEVGSVSFPCGEDVHHDLVMVRQAHGGGGLGA